MCPIGKEKLVFASTTRVVDVASVGRKPDGYRQAIKRKPGR
jgi:hypothetical protein